MIGGAYNGSVYINGRRVACGGWLGRFLRKLKISLVVAGLISAVVVWVKVQAKVDATRFEDEKKDTKAKRSKKA